MVFESVVDLYMSLMMMACGTVFELGLRKVGAFGGVNDAGGLDCVRLWTGSHSGSVVSSSNRDEGAELL